MPSTEAERLNLMILNQLLSWESALSAREAALSPRESMLATRDSEQSIRESEYADRESALVEREAQVVRAEEAMRVLHNQHRQVSEKAMMAHEDYWTHWATTVECKLGTLQAQLTDIEKQRVSLEHRVSGGCGYVHLRTVRCQLIAALLDDSGKAPRSVREGGRVPAPSQPSSAEPTRHRPPRRVRHGPQRHDRITGVIGCVSYHRHYHYHRRQSRQAGPTADVDARKESQERRREHRQDIGMSSSALSQCTSPLDETFSSTKPRLPWYLWRCVGCRRRSNESESGGPPISRNVKCGLLCLTVGFVLV